MEDLKVVSTRSRRPHAEYKKKEKSSSLEKEKEVPIEEGPTKDKEAPTKRSSETWKQNGVLTPP